MATQQEIDIRKAELRKIGMAGFHISIEGKTLSENDSIGQELDESWSTFYICVKCPYSRVKPGNMRFRLFQTLKDKPSIPMGYSGMFSFTFDCYDGRPREQAVLKLKEITKNDYRYKFVHKDEISCERILSAEQKQAKDDATKEEKEKYITGDSDSDYIKGLKGDILRLEALSAKYKEINKAVKAGDHQKLLDLGLTDGRISQLENPAWGRPGIAGYQFTSISSKIRRIKAKIDK